MKRIMLLFTDFFKLKKTGFLLFFITSHFFYFSSFSQNVIVGSGFTNGWNNSDFQAFTSSAGTTWIRNETANGTGNQYFRLGVDWSGTQKQLTITPGSDVSVSANTTYSLSSSSTTNGAMYFNVANTSYNYIFKTKDAGVTPTGQFVFFEVQGTVRSITGVSQSPIAENVAQNSGVSVNATLDGALSTGQCVYLRYSNDNFSTSTVVQMTGSGTSYSANIPSSINTYNSTVKYYVFSSGCSGVSTDGSNADLYTINLNNNSGSNYSYSINITDYASAIFLNKSGTSSFYNTTGSGADLIGSSSFSGSQGSYVRGSSNLKLSGAEFKTRLASSGFVCSTGEKVYYRYYKQGSTPPAYSSFSLTRKATCSGSTFTDGFGPCQSNDEKWNTQSQNIDLTCVASTGTYVLDVYYEYTGSNSGGGCGITNTIGSSTTPYTSNYDITNDSFSSTASSNSPICSGSTLNLLSTPTGGTSPYTYAWTGPSSFTSTAQNPIISNATTAATGVYNLTVTDACGGTTTATTTATVNSIPATPSISIDNSTICSGTSATLSANGCIGTVTWSNSTTGATIAISTAGVYTATCTVNGCTSSSSSSVSLAVNALPIASSTPNCNTATKSLEFTTTAVTGATYSWVGPNGFSSIEQSPTISFSGTAGSKIGNYILTVSKDGCSASTTLTNVNCSSSPLPVNLTGFSATTVDEKVKLDWETASETNNAYFEIERSADVKSFAKIGQVAGQINSSALIQYSFIDEQPQSGINYYRLRQVDLDGKFEYSKIRSAIVEKGISVNISPNPTDDYIVLRGLPENSSFEIVDLNGSSKYQKLVKDNAAEHRVNVSQYGSGLYIVRITSGDKVEVRKFFIN